MIRLPSLIDKWNNHRIPQRILWLFFYINCFFFIALIDVNMDIGTTINAVTSMSVAKGTTSSGKSESRYSINLLSIISKRFGIIMPIKTGTQSSKININVVSMLQIIIELVKVTRKA